MDGDGDNMDGAVNLNPSNSSHVMTSRDAKKIEKSMAKEAAAAQKYVTQVGKALKSAVQDESKAEKVSITR
jgi:hypothetical protein